MPTIPPSARRAFRLPVSSAGLARELDNEVQFHLDARVADLVARGMTPADALADALRRFGDADDLRDYCHSLETAHMRRVRLSEWFNSLIQDVHFALRQLHRSPGFALVVVLTLGLGLGATTTVFTVVDSVLLRPLAYPEADRIVQLWEVGANGGQAHMADPNFFDLRDQSRSFSSIAEEAGGGVVSVSGTDEPVRARLAIVSSGFFPVLGLHPVIGRLFVEGELHPGGAPAAIVGHAFWQERLGGTQSALGRQLHIGAASYTVVGVMPAELDFPAGSEIWIPRELDAPVLARTAHNWDVIARLAPGITREQAQSGVSAIAKRIKQRVGTETDMADVALVPLREQLAGATRPALLLTLGGAAILLLIACANVANLMIARLASRQGEVAMRLALGAARSRIVQQFLVESLALSLMAGLVGLALAQMGVRGLAALQPANLPRAHDVHIDWTVLLFAFALSATVAVALGVSSAWRGTRGNLRDQLSQAPRTLSGGASSHRLRGALVVTQVALTVVLLVFAGLLSRSFERLLKVDPGFRTDSSIALDIAAELGSAQERARFYDELTARLRAMPGVTSVGATNRMPLAPGGRGNGSFVLMRRTDQQMTMDEFQRLGRDPDQSGDAEFRVVGPDYFSTMHIPLLQGRAFREADAPGMPHVAVVSASLARERWAAGNPIGKIIQFGDMDGDVTPFTVVGVVGDVREASLASRPQPTFYASYRQRPARTGQFTIVIAYRGPSAPIIVAAQQIVRMLRPDVPPRFRTIEQIVAGSVTDRRFALLLVGVFGIAALALASLGVYSVISYLVTQRARELSIRVALGAGGTDVILLVVGQAAALVFGGILVGTAASVATTRIIGKFLYDVSATDPVAFIAVITLLAAVALAASYVPARRAARAAPMDVLRSG